MCRGDGVLRLTLEAAQLLGWMVQFQPQSLWHDTLLQHPVLILPNYHAALARQSDAPSRFTPGFAGRFKEISDCCREKHMRGDGSPLPA